MSTNDPPIDERGAAAWGELRRAAQVVEVQVARLALEARRWGRRLVVRERRQRFAADPLGTVLEEIFSRSEDFVTRHLLTPDGSRWRLFFFEGLVSREDAEERLIAPLLAGAPLQAADLRREADPERLAAALLAGNTILLREGAPEAFVIANPGGKSRGIGKPTIEISILGPHEAFDERLADNASLLRRRLRDRNLVLQRHRVGERSPTPVYLTYLEDVANPALVEDVRRRLGALKVDAILDSSQLERLLNPRFLSPFPLMENTERPDILAAALLEGRVGLLVEGSPTALIAPATLDSLFHSPEDSYLNWGLATTLRFVRFVGSFIALLLPGAYVALVAYNPGLMPTQLALKVSSAREGVAFPVIIEALLIQSALELLKEAGLRMPSPIGQIFGIVGGLVLGQIGVQAGVFSQMMVIVIATTAVASFAIATYELNTAIRLLGLPLMLMSALFGVFGLVMGLMMLLAHLTSLRSFGVPYLVPYFYYPPSDFKDTLIRLPWQSFRRRPTFLQPRQLRRAGGHRRQRGEIGHALGE